MHQLDACKLSFTDFTRAELCDATREFGSVQITNPHNIARCELAFATRNARRQQTFSRVTQRFARAVIHEQRAFRMMKERDPAFASLKLVRLRSEDGSLVLTAGDFRENVFLFCPTR